jgi:nucleoside 2-deoxyribosyltransferase
MGHDMSGSSESAGEASVRPRVYLAGPDVFLPNAVAIGLQKKNLCEQYGLEGLYPMDSEANLQGLAPREAALHIGRLNHELIIRCDYVVANITPFRGPSADVGTVYEMGFGAGLGKTVSAYSNVSMPFAERTRQVVGVGATADDQRIVDKYGMTIESWGLADNLMIESCIERTGGFLVIDDAPVGQMFSHLRAFEECLRILKNQVGSWRT